MKQILDENIFKFCFYFIIIIIIIIIILITLIYKIMDLNVYSEFYHNIIISHWNISWPILLDIDVC